MVSHEFSVKEKFKIFGHTDRITNIVHVEDMKMYITSCFDGKIRFFEQRDLAVINRFELPREGIVENLSYNQRSSTQNARPIVGMVFS